MKILEIAALFNGAHRNQTVNGEIAIPDGWAVIPEGMELENFPFGEVAAEEIEGVMAVTGWTPGEMPEPEQVEESAAGFTDAELAKAILDGVNNI